MPRDKISGKYISNKFRGITSKIANMKLLIFVKKQAKTQIRAFGSGS